MQLQDRVVVVTGGANGIGRAMCRRFGREGARAIIVADLDLEAAQQVAEEIGGLAIKTDVGVEADLVQVVRETVDRYGAIDLFCSNAGIVVEGDVAAPNDQWQRIWEVNVMAHVYAARAVLPSMIERGDGYLLQTASAAGLLSQIGSAPYSVTKHAAVALAEWLSLTYGDRGVRVSCLCPLGVRTQMLANASGNVADMLMERALDPEVVAEAVIRGLADERFLILPHEEVAEFVRRKADNPDRWLRGMRRLNARYVRNQASSASAPVI